MKLVVSNETPVEAEKCSCATRYCALHGCAVCGLTMILKYTENWEAPRCANCWYDAGAPYHEVDHEGRRVGPDR